MTTTPTDDVTHKAFVPMEGAPRPACGGIGPSTLRTDEVTCPACLQHAADRRARITAEVNDTHAIPANDEPEPAVAEEIKPGDICRDRDDDEWVAVSTGHETFLVGPVYLHETKQVVEKHGPLVKYDLSEGGPISDAAAALAPTKTHDLSVRKLHGGTVIAAESEADSYGAYLPPGAALDLGRVLALLTPAQRQLLIDELTGGAK